MNKCTRCYSYAINPRSHDRDPTKNLDLCDVCYWRAEYENLKTKLSKILESN